jgi:RpiB/LacA/LacB family sugar-phosphate isomerase
MRIAIACDHGGFPLKNMIMETVRAQGYEAIDFGTFSQESVDYPDFVEKAGLSIQQKQADRAIIVCGSGVGACIAANKMKGLYASICHDTYSAHQGVEHDDMNVLCLGARIIGAELAREIVITFLNATFSNGERHVRRVQKTRLLEQKFFSPE